MVLRYQRGDPGGAVSIKDATKSQIAQETKTMNIERNTSPLRNIHTASVRTLTLVAVASLFVSGCAMTETQQRTGTGAAVGALGGALLGTSRQSAAIGAAVGATGGFLFDQFNKREDAQSENERLRQENERLRQQTGQ